MHKLALVFLLSVMMETPSLAMESDLENLSGIETTLDPCKGLVVDSVKTGSVADRAGLLPMDIITGIDNSPFSSDPSYVMVSIDGALFSGRSVLLEILRAGDKKIFWLKQEKLSFHQKKALVVYNEIRTEWNEIKKGWQDFSNYLDQVRLKKIAPEEFQKNALKKANHLQLLRSRMITGDRKVLQSLPQFEREITRIKDLTCRAIFTMDETMQRAASYSKDNKIGEHFNKLEQRKKNISQQISAVELHLLKAKQTADL